MNTLQKQTLSLSSANDVMTFAKTLQKYIADNKLSCIIQSKNYVYVDGWKFCGVNFNLTAIPSRPVKESEANEVKYSCECDIINMATDKKVGYGFAVCSNKESKKKTFDEYAIASMAQTRAIGKAYRNLLGYVMSAAGYEPTPAEEMSEQGTPVQADYSDVKEQVELLNTMPELQKYWEGLPELQKDKAFISIINNRKVQIQKQK